jgi:hypothetical protein
MNADLIQEAVVGSSDAWSLLLRCGSENLDAAANYQPTKTKLTKNDYCKKETTETLSEDEAKAALKPGEFVDLNRSASYVVNASRLNKKLPNVLAVDFFYKFKRYTFFSKSTYEAIASLTGNAGSWLWGFDEFREELKSYYPTLFHTLRLAPKEAEKAELRIWKSGDSIDERVDALRALRRRDPNRARELLAKWVSKEDRKRKRKYVRDRSKENFLNALAVGLSIKDEPFLEKTIADKIDDQHDDEINARRVAFLLLCKIPDSQRSLAMQERAEAVLRGEVPEYDAECQLAQFSKIEYPLIVDIAASLPLQYWTEARGRSPKQLAQKYPCAEEHEPLYIGWLKAFINDVCDFRDKNKLDDPQEIIQSSPGADEWISVFLDFWEYLTEFTTYADMEEQRYFSVIDALANLKELLSRCGSKVAFQLGERGAENKPENLFSSFDPGVYFRDYSMFEPKPWSEAFMKSYFQHVDENRVPGFETAIVFDMGFFSPKWRKKIVQLAKERPELQQQSSWFYPATLQEICYNPTTAEELYAAVEEYIACFGEFSD